MHDYQIGIRIKNAICITLLFFSMTSYSIGAEPYVKLDGHSKIKLNEQRLWHQTENLEKNPTFSSLTQLYQNSNVVTSTFGGSGAYIAKINLSNLNIKNDIWFVNIQAIYLDIGTAYWQPENGKPIQLENFGQMDSDNPKLAHSQAFSLPLKPKENGTLWVYIQAKMFATPVIIELYNKTEFYQKQFLINSITSISFTMMMTLALIALIIYFRTKYLVTLACTGYIGIQGLGWFTASGSFGHLFTVATINPVYSGILLFPFAIAFASQFTKLLFNCKKEHPTLTKIFNLLSVACLTVGIIMPFFPFTLSFLISHVIAIIWIPLCISTGTFMLAKKDFRAKYYLAGNLIYSLALTGYVLSHLYKVDWNISLEVIVQVALTIDCICILLSLAEWLQIQQKEFHRNYAISRIDPLTQIGNRFAQNEKLANLKGEYCITFIDLDGFKKINDKFGHDEGDKILVTTANIMQKNLQGLGSIFRCGGDEFICVIEINTPQHIESLLIDLTKLLLKIEKEIQQSSCSSAGLSFGIATSLETQNQSECLSLADQRMYKYKQDNK